MTIHLSIMLFWPLAAALAAAGGPERLALAAGPIGAPGPPGHADTHVVDIGAHPTEPDAVVGGEGVRGPGGDLGVRS